MFCKILFPLAILTLLFCGCNESDELVLVPQYKNIGEIGIEDGGLVSIPFEIRNRTDSEVTIRAGSVPCVCTKLEIGSPIIPQRSTRKITMSIDSSRLSGHQTISAELLTNHPNFPLFQPKAIGFFGLPKIQTDYAVDLGSNYLASSIDALLKLPLEEGLVPYDFEVDESLDEKLRFSVVNEYGIAYLKVFGNFPSQVGGFRSTGKLKFSGSSKQATLRVDATIISCFDSPVELH